jgi:hypothetical protein
MELAKSRKKMAWRECAYASCSNTFYGSQFQKYCNDSRCKEMREAAKPRVRKKDKDADNRVIPKIVLFRAISMKKGTLWLKCQARDASGKRCGKRFSVNLNARQSVYPKFCEDHRNAYKRKRYMLSREI